MKICTDGQNSIEVTARDFDRRAKYHFSTSEEFVIMNYSWPRDNTTISKTFPMV